MRALSNAWLRLSKKLIQPVDLRLVSIVEDAEQPLPRSNFSREEFECAVKRTKEYIAAGDVFQVVLSQRFEAPFDGEPLDFYRCLRFINPSPYMFVSTSASIFSLVGSSPEMHVRMADDSVEIRPIAGTRVRV